MGAGTQYEVALQSRASPGPENGRTAGHTRATFSSVRGAMYFPSGLQETRRTEKSAAASTNGSPDPSAFQTRAVVSADAVATRAPSGLKLAQ